MNKNIVRSCILCLFSCLLLSAVGAEGVEAKVGSVDELKAALANPNVQLVRLVSEFTLEADEKAPETLFFDKPVVVEAPVTFVFTEIVNKSRLTVRSTLKLGAAKLINNGSIRVEKSGFLAVNMSVLDNQGTVFVLAGAELVADRGGKVQNSEILINRGTLQVTNNGANLTMTENSILDNQGKMTADGYFNNNGGVFLGDTAWLKKIKK